MWQLAAHGSAQQLGVGRVWWQLEAGQHWQQQAQQGGLLSDSAGADKTEGQTVSGDLTLPVFVDKETSLTRNGQEH